MPSLTPPRHTPTLPTPAVRRVGARLTLRAQCWIDGREFEQADQCKGRTLFVEGVQSAKIRKQRAHWPSVPLRQEFVQPATRWWLSTERPWAGWPHSLRFELPKPEKGTVRASLTAS